jgi:hypothetical protein
MNGITMKNAPGLENLTEIRHEKKPKLAHFSTLKTGGKDVKILVACEFSGIVRGAFIAKGHDAISCDLLPTERPGPHYRGDVMDIINNGFDLMIAHPPCTHLAVSGAPHFKNKKHQQEDAIEFVRKLMNAPIAKICIENPVSVISSKIRPPDQIIQPYYFGDNVPKKTCLWLKNLPQLLWFDKGSLFKSDMVDPEYLVYKSKKTKSGVSRYSIFGKLGKGHGHERSRTFQGIASAMANQWG